MTTKSESQDVLAHFVRIGENVCGRLAKNRRVRRTLPGKGRLRIDRQLPFLCIYRSVPGVDDAGTKELVTSEAAYLFASGEPLYHKGLSALCQRVSETMREYVGMFLVIEVWSHIPDAQGGEHEAISPLQPGFEIVTDEREKVPETISTLKRALSEVSIGSYTAQVDVRTTPQVAPPGLPPLDHNICDDATGSCLVLGLAVRPVFRDNQTDTIFPRVLQSLREQLAKALRKAIAEFAADEESSDGKRHFDSLGPTSMVKAARLADQQLSELSGAFDFLLQVTPVNSDEAWRLFENDAYQIEPAFTYRPLPYDVNLLKRRLFDIEIERIEDPTLARMFWEQQAELDRQLTALRDLNTPDFMFVSFQLYGSADEKLEEIAKAILARFPTPSPLADEDKYVEATQVAAIAREEIDYYHEQLPEFNATVEICNHIASGIMVSQDKLLIAESLRIREDRVRPLLHHEIGTHLVTYFNGRCQPLRQLYVGLTGYDELQEGLAVLAEYLSGGLTPNRVRNLAGRVIAVAMMTNGASFVETFDQLHEHYAFAARQAFTTTLRVFRGGGLTKDVIYLRGLRDVLNYLAEGHELESLYVGKVGLQHLPYIQEMRRRGILHAPAVLPRFWKHPAFQQHLDSCRGLTVLQLLENMA